MEPLFTPDQLRREGQRQRQHLRVAQLIALLLLAGLIVLAVVTDEPGIGLLAALVIVPIVSVATIATRREVARWEAATAAGALREWRGVVTGFSSNTYGIRWGVEVAVDHPPGSSIRLKFRHRRNPGYGKGRLREGDPVRCQLAAAGKQLFGALHNERTGDVVLVETRQRLD